MIGETILLYKIIEKLGEVRPSRLNRDGRDLVPIQIYAGRIDKL
jgi:hypothetical protein